MRALISAKIIDALRKRDVRAVRRFEAAVLYDLAERSFGLSGTGRVSCAAAGDPLKTYARFTVRCMEKTSPDPERLYAEAYRLGQRIRRVSGLSSKNDLRRLIEYLYRNIDISLRWTADDSFTVSRCFFSGHYSPEHCRVMSNVDSGIIGGILGGGSIVFTERITEGCGSCRACLLKETEEGGRI